MLINFVRPRFYYGWLITWTLAITETISWGVLFYAFSVLIVPTEAEFGWSRSEITGAFSVATLMMGISALGVGYWIDRYGARLLMTIGSIAGTILVLVWANIESLWGFYLLWAALGITMAATLYDPAFIVVANWFTSRRSQALAIVTFVAGFASTIFMPLTAWLVELYGWRSALIILAWILATTTIPAHLLVLRRRPEDLELRPDGEARPLEAPSEASQLQGAVLKQALQDPVFWLWAVAFALTAVLATAVVVHLIPFLLTLGYSNQQAAWVTGAIGGLKLLGRFCFAPIYGRLSGKWVAALLFALEGIAVLLLLLSPTLPGLIVFVVIFGAAYGAVTLARWSLLADRYGTAQFGRISSVFSLLMMIANTVAPVSAGMMYVALGSYQPVWITLLSLSIVAVLVVLLAKTNVPVWANKP